MNVHTGPLVLRSPVVLIVVLNLKLLATTASCQIFNFI
jgi:hypothetical protein